MPTFKNYNEFEKFFNSKLQKAMELTRDEVFEVVSRKVSDYYNEDVFATPPTDVPDYYERTGTLMESLSGGHVIKQGNAYSFTVGFDDDYLEFRYSGGFTTRRYGSKYNAITGEQVLQAFNTGTHGYTVQGSHNYWDEALDEINSRGGLDGILKRNLIKLGVPIR